MDRNDLGVFQRVFKVGDRVRISIKLRLRTLAKFASMFSEVNLVRDFRRVLVSNCEVSTGRVYFVNYYRLTYILLNLNFAQKPETLPGS